MIAHLFAVIFCCSFLLYVHRTLSVLNEYKNKNKKEYSIFYMNDHFLFSHHPSSAHSIWIDSGKKMGGTWKRYLFVACFELFVFLAKIFEGCTFRSGTKEVCIDECISKQWTIFSQLALTKFTTISFLCQVLCLLHTHICMCNINKQTSGRFLSFDSWIVQISLWSGARTCTTWKNL